MADWCTAAVLLPRFVPDVSCQRANKLVPYNWQLAKPWAAWLTELGVAFGWVTLKAKRWAESAFSEGSK